MAIAVDASTPVRATANATTVPTASFTPPANSILIATVQGSGAAAANPTVAITNTGTVGPWTQIANVNNTTAGGTENGVASIHWALVSTSNAITVTATQTNGSADTSLKVYVLTGCNTSSPVGALVTGHSSTDPINPTITTTTDNCLVVGSASEFNDAGTPTSSTAGFTADTFSSTASAGLSTRGPVATSGTVQAINLDASGTTGLWQYALVEIKQASAPVSSPGTIVEDASSPATVTFTANTSATTVTASFTPPANSLLIAVSANQWNTSYSGTPASTITYSDSLSGTWTPINNANAGANGSVMCSTAYRIIGSSAAMTVTATSVDSLSKTKLLTVRVLAGAALSGTIATSLFTGFATTANFTQQTVTTTTAGSKPIIVVSDDNAQSTTPSLAVNANTTEYGQIKDTSVSSTSASGRATNLTTTPGSLSIGWTGATSGFQQAVCVIEVMPGAAATSTAVDRSNIVGNVPIMRSNRY